MQVIIFYTEFEKYNDHDQVQFLLEAACVTCARVL